MEKISGKILLPGETFSYNQTVGPRTRATGFLPAPAIVHEALRPVIGGGICQVSSTLFDAVLLSDLKVLERHRHYTPVNYLPLGMDATISWGTKDFRFRNTSPESVQHRPVSGHAHVQIYGENPRTNWWLETVVESPGPHPDSLPAGYQINLDRQRRKAWRVNSFTPTSRPDFQQPQSHEPPGSHFRPDPDTGRGAARPGFRRRALCPAQSPALHLHLRATRKAPPCGFVRPR